MSRRYVIVGNGIAGQTCAEELRRNDPDCTITMFTRERHPLYNRVALPRFLKGQLSRDKVVLRSVEDYAHRRIDIHFETGISRIDPGAGCAVAEDGRVFPFDAALIASGGRPRALSAPGVDLLDNAHSFQTLDDAEAIGAAAAEARRVLVIGGSFIAYELAEAIGHRRPGAVTWLMRGPWFLRSVLDADAGRLCADFGRAAGVDMVCSDAVAHFERDSEGMVCVTAAGRRISFDMLVYGLGLEFNVEAASAGGIAVDGGILTDACLRTNAPNVYAAGDVAVFLDPVRGVRNQLGTWDNALAQGHTAALNMADGAMPFIDVATYTTTMFGSTMAVIGATRPGGSEAVMLGAQQYRKLFFEEDRLVGAILIGSPKGRKKMIDLIRTGAPLDAEQRALILQGAL